MLRDVTIRKHLKAAITRKHGSERGTAVIDELGLCRKVRVDVVVVNGELVGYEIKSAADTLRRLPRQVDTYGQVLDRVALVTEERHVDSALLEIPEWWGVMIAACGAGKTDPVRFTELRPCGPNPGLNPRAIVELLWREEALSLLAQRGAARGLLTKPRRHAWDRLCEVLTLDEIRFAVRERLRARFWRAAPARPSRGGRCRCAATRPTS